MTSEFDQLLDYVRDHDIGVPDGESCLIGGVFCKKFELKAGQTIVSHKHRYDHMSILAKGEVIVRQGDGDRHYSAPAEISIRAHVHHAIVTLSDVTWYCIHAVDRVPESGGQFDEGQLIVTG